MTIRSQTRTPGEVVSDDAVGTIAWTDPEKAEVEDNDPATAEGPGTSEYLKATDWDFALKSTAQPLQAWLLPRRRATGINPSTISRRGGTWEGVSDSSTLTIDAPSGIQDGDVLIATVADYNSLASITPPSGWSLIVGDVWANENGTVRTYYHVVTDAGSEPTSYTWAYTAPSTHRWGTIDAYVNVDPSSPFASTAQSGKTENATSPHGLPSVTTTVDEAMVHGVLVANSAGTLNDSAVGMTRVQGEHVLVTVSRIAVYNELRPTAGATGARTITYSSNTSSHRAVISLRPKPNPLLDHDVRLLADGAPYGANIAGAASWAAAYQEDTLGPVDISALSVAQVNHASEFGGLISVALLSGQVAELDVLAAMISYDIAVDVTITAPSTDPDSPNMTVTWDAEVAGSPITQAAKRVRIYRRPDLLLLYDSGEIADATQSHLVGSGSPAVPWTSPQNGVPIRIRVDVVEDGTADPDGTGPAIEGFGEIDVVTAWTPPPPPTGFTATAVTEIP